MEERNYISVILPLRLRWNPYYMVGAGVAVGRGDRVRVSFAGREYVGVVANVGGVPDTDLKKVLKINGLADLPRISENELKLWEFVSDYYMCSIGEVYKTAYPAGRVSGEVAARKAEEKRTERVAAKRAELEAKISAKKDWLACKRVALNDTSAESAKAAELRGQIERGEEAVSRLEGQLRELGGERTGAEAPGTEADAGARIVLTPQQEAAAEAIRSGLAGNGTVLLHGVTGSGKTEIYITLAMEQLSRGRNVLYLVPEIALSRQLEERLRKVFGSDLLVFHSGESFAARRYVAGSMAGSRYIVLGTRSSIFLPHHDLGLIVVDEEHDTSYKQDSPSPHYQGRDTAVMMGKIHGCGVLLGSATPSLESLYNCSIGRYTLVSLTTRFFGSQDSDIEVIDTIAERRKNGMIGDFSRILLAAMRKTLSAGDQIVILRGRRAYSPIVQCKECGSIPKCPNCNVTLSYHKDRGRLVCHYCGYSEPFTGRCIECGGELEPMGAGTQKIEEEVSELFPQAKVARLDADTSGGAASIVREFADGKIDILVGTQIVTKGFDFGRLALVVVLNADSLLGQQDFRADEKAYQLLEQLRGRSGRRGERGLLMIQTSRPDHPVYGMLRGQGAVDQWLKERREFGYPPYTRIINVIVRDPNESRLGYLSSLLAGGIASALGTRPAMIPSADADACVIGPYAPVIDRISRESIRHIRIILRRDKSLMSRKKLISGAIQDFEDSRKYSGHITLDVDPA